MNYIKSIINQLGYDITKVTKVEQTSQKHLDTIPDLTQMQRTCVEKALPFSMTSVERMASLVQAVSYISQNKIAGDIAECGVWRGGSMMSIALTLLDMGDVSRSLYLYDTFEGMSSPTDEDKSLDGTTAENQLKAEPKGTGIWCHATIEDVKENILSTGYPEEKIHFIKGKVEDTIPTHITGPLALLRLDTDWYESTKHELVHLYPKLDRRGILMIDDYGHWQGAKKAVDEYFSDLGIPVYLHRVDYTGRIVVRNGE